MKKIKLAFISLAALVGVLTFAPSYVHATPASDAQSGVNAAGTDSVSLSTRIKSIVNLLLYVLGAISVVMIVIGGIRYTTSNGDSSNIKSAKDTILYSIVGLVVAMLAFAIVNFVLSSFK